MTIYCSQCGHRNEDAVEHCAACGSEIARIGEPALATARRRSPDLAGSPTSGSPEASRRRPSVEERAESGDPCTAGASGTKKGGTRATLLNAIIAVLCVFYLINPTRGLIELIPDVVPIIGNLDEVVVVIGLLVVLSAMGVIPWTRTK